jgi:hypothetical protein
MLLLELNNFAFTKFVEQFSQMCLRKDATEHLVIRVDKLLRKTTIFAKIAFLKGGFIDEYRKLTSAKCPQVP